MPPASALTDQALLERFAKRGDEQAFAAIVQRYADPVYGTCLRVLRNRAKAQDAAQETFFRLVRRPGDVQQSLGGWLHRVATTQSIDALRRDRSRRERELQHQRERQARGETASWQELSPHVDVALAELPDEQRWLLVQHYLCRRSLASLRAEAGVSTPTLSRRHRAALESVRAILRKHGVFTGPAALTAMLTHHTAHAAPPTLAVQLGKMTLLSGATGPGAGGVKTAGWLAAAVLTMVLAGAVTSAILTADSLAPPTAAAAEADDASAPHPPAPFPPPVPPAQATPPSPFRYVVVPGPADFDSRMLAVVQDPAGATDGHVAVVFRDNHTATIPIAEAKQRVVRQTGRTLARLAAQQRARQLSQGP